MEHLTLRGPARGLWLATRDSVRRALVKLEPGIEYRIGGGSVLAARWGHRHSVDVDIQVDKDTPLGRLEGDAYRWLHEEIDGLGAATEYNATLNMYRIRRREDAGASPEVQIWGHDLDIARGHATGRVENREETVLSTAQILRGKLARAHRHPARDVYDVNKASGIDPASLEIAVNTMPHEAVAKAALSWIVAYGRIGNNAHQRLAGLAADEERHHYEIAKTGAGALIRARYARLRLGVEDDRIIVEAVTHADTHRRMSMTAAEADEQFEAMGINGHLRDKGPGAGALREYAVELAGRRAGNVLVFEERGDEETRWRTATAARSMEIIRADKVRLATETSSDWEPSWKYREG